MPSDQVEIKSEPVSVELPNQNPEPSRYDEADIQVLEGLEAVRKRPGMYVGGTDIIGLHHLVWEAVDNAIDEVMAGRADMCHVHVHADGSISIIDNGSGIPVGPMQHENPSFNGKPAVEVVMTILHAGGKFDNSAYKVSGGLHGVGISCVNALSEWLEVEVTRQGKVYLITFERGKVDRPLHIINENLTDDTRSGTRITFKPDSTIFPETDFDFDLLRRRLRELAYLNSGVTIRLTDERVGADGKPKEHTFSFSTGIIAYVDHLSESKNTICDTIYLKSKEDKDGELGCEIALRYTDAYSENTICFTNNIFNSAGGTHLTGFKNALTRTLNNYARKANLIKDVTPSGDDLREGLVAVVSLKHPDPQFNNQPKERLLSTDVEGFISQIVNEQLTNWLEEHPSEAKKICSNGVLAAMAREAARKARELTRRKSALEGGEMPSKLADCTTKDIERSEIFLVEGDSAGGSAKGGRETEFQAILPLRGKILNVEKARIDKMLSFAEIRTIIQALKCGIGNECDPSQLRYGKVIIMTDADVDGSHIRTLLLTFFFRHMQELVRRGHIYIAQPPLYQVKRNWKSQYILNDRQLETALTDIALNHATLIIKDEDGREQRRLDEGEARQAVRLLSRLTELVRVVEMRGILFTQLLATRADDPDDENRLPSHRLMWSDGDAFCWSEEHARQLMSDYGLHLDELRAPSSSADPTGREEDDIDSDRDSETHLNDVNPNDKPASLRELHENKELSSLFVQLAELDIDINDYDLVQEEDITGELKSTRYGWVVRQAHSQSESDEENSTDRPEEKTIPAPGVSSILKGLHEVGRQGMEIKRFKGLGEMDPEQLWDTTMDPSRRTLMRVTWDTASEADVLFSILMGENVEKRRAYIEEHALEVKNLDI